MIESFKSILGDIGSIKIIVTEHLPKDTIAVSPDVQKRILEHAKEKKCRHHFEYGHVDDKCTRCGMTVLEMSK